MTYLTNINRKIKGKTQKIQQKKMPFFKAKNQTWGIRLIYRPNVNQVVEVAQLNMSKQMMWQYIESLKNKLIRMLPRAWEC